MKTRYGIVWRLPLFAAIAVMLVGGCARYEYVLVEPSRFAGTIGKEGLSASYEPLEYKFAKRDGRLAMNIANPTDQPVTMVGTKSYVVDPMRQTRPLKGGSIAPRSYIGLVLPPEPPVYRAGPSFSFGLGLGYHASQDHPYLTPGFGYDTFYSPPSYYYLDSPDYWDWKRGKVEMRLFYEQGNTNTLDHRFIFLRQKAKDK